MEQPSSGLEEALASSSQQRALYNDGKTRAFVSKRAEDRYDLGVRNLQDPTQRVTKFDESVETLRLVLETFGVPEGEGWHPSK